MNRIEFNQLMHHLRPRLYRFVLAFTRHSDESEDIVQEIGVKLWERRAELDSLKSVEAYAICSAKNRCLDLIRTQHRTTDLNEAVHNTTDKTPYQSTEQADTVAFIRKMIDRLPVQQQMVIRLRDIEGYELDEIARMMEMNEGAVRTNLSRARQKIREELLKQMKT